MPKQIVVLGIDLGKNSCSVVGLNGAGEVVLRRRLQRESLMKLTSELAPQWRPRRRESYEDRYARISILARANAQRPDTLMQTEIARSTNLLADGAGIRWYKPTARGGGT